MKHILARLYIIYALIVFSVLFIILLPFFLIFIFILRHERAALTLNLVWTRLFFPLILMPVDVEWRFEPIKQQNYILCANHFSYLDIALIAYTPFTFVFVGKSSLTKIPLFGLMYKSLHITVDRAKIKSGYDTFRRSAAKLRAGQSLAIFPEGGIRSQNPPEMVRFKDGAFRIAIETQTPIVPVTLPHNWKIMPDNKSVSMFWKRNKVIYHQPISTEGYNIEDMESLKTRVHQTITEELRNHMT